MRDTALWAVIVAAIAVVVNAGVSIFLHFTRARFEQVLAERKAALDYQSAQYQRRLQLASEILTAFYEVRRMMPAIRSPGSWQGEGASRARIDGESADLQKTRDTYYVTIARLDKNREAIVRFLSKQFSAMALLGPEAATPFEELNQLLNRISGSASMLIMTAGSPTTQKGKWLADIWEGYGVEAKDQDRVQIELAKISDAVEALCKPILTAKAPLLADTLSKARSWR
jgi:hypothetical protein